MTVSVAFETKTVSLRTGVILEYVEQGDPDGIPVILLHGLSDSWRSYELVLPYLPPSIRAYAVSERGHGESSRPVAGYTTTDFAADVAAFLDAQGFDRAVVVGHSMSASIALQFAIDYPDHLLGLVVVGTFLDFAGNPVIAEFNEALATFTDPIDPAFAREFQESTLAKSIPPAYLDTVVAESLKLPARAWKAIIAGLIATDFSADLSGIAAPTLVIWGDQDAYPPRADQDRLASAIPNARLFIYESTGHAVHWEEPARFAADLTSFVEQLAG
jgi:pimeloyl-ACP methyl ester carboxylesterase